MLQIKIMQENKTAPSEKKIASFGQFYGIRMRLHTGPYLLKNITPLEKILLEIE